VVGTLEVVGTVAVVAFVVVVVATAVVEVMGFDDATVVLDVVAWPQALNATMTDNKLSTMQKIFFFISFLLLI
jgi:hypothetical protein